MLEHWSDYLSITWNLVFGAIGVILNIVLIYLVQKHTPEAMKVYVTVIRIGSICDVIISFAAMMASARVYSSGISLIIMFHGLTKYLPIHQNSKPYFAFFWFTFEVHGYLFSLFVILFSLYYRQHTITHLDNSLTQKRVNLICYGFSLLSFVYTSVIGNLTTPLDQIDDFVRNIKPELIGSGWIYYVLLDVGGLSETLVIVMNWIVLIFGIVCRKRVNQKLSTLNSSASTKKLQKALMKILLIQITTPFVQIFALIIHYMCTIRNDLQTPFIENTLELFPILLSSITPIVTIYYIEPYRKVIERLYGKKDVQPINNSAVSSSHT